MSTLIEVALLADGYTREVRNDVRMYLKDGVGVVFSNGIEVEIDDCDNFNDLYRSFEAYCEIAYDNRTFIKGPAAQTEHSV